jgi:antitoxin MazE
MTGHIQKWGNSYALRIPKPFADELNWKAETSVKVTIEEGKLVIEAIRSPEYELEDLLEGMTPEDFQEDIDTGFAVGNEVW